ncbi:MAG: hypothetical protein NZ960_05620 [Candidatus Kapabacteria bacterium]|nr:hypothetical protein [Candidatus Kapabacteria bacterium]MDW8012691.1 hypothetical protein [Bacteroidota bacterium]
MATHTQWLLIGGSLAYAVWSLLSVPWWTVDDAYILFRYAQHWVTIGIPTWNPGEPPVEGYTGTLYVALLAVGHAVGLPFEALAKGIGLTAYALCGAVTWFLLRELGVQPAIRVLSIVLYYTAAFLFVHALSGLETTLFLFLLTASTWLAVRTVLSPSSANLLKTILALVLLALTRPEGLLFSMALLVAIFVSTRAPGSATAQRTSSSLRWSRLAWGSLLFALPVVAMTLWRWHLYGELLPNTYYAKQAGGIVIGSMLSFLEFALQYWAVPGMIALLLGVGEWEQWTARLRTHYRQLMPLGIALGAAVAVLIAEYARSSLQMNYAHRFWAPLYVLGLCGAAVGAEHGLRTLQETTDSHPLRLQRLQQIALVLMLLQLTIHGGLWRWQERKFVRDYWQLLNEEHAEAAQFLQHLLPPTATVVIYPDAGLIPFRTGFRTIDGGRLNDRFLARHHWSGSLRDTAILNYLFSQQPAAFVFKSRREDRPLLNAELSAIVNDQRFSTYRLAASFRTRARRFAESYFLLVYVHQRYLPLMLPTVPGL